MNTTTTDPRDVLAQVIANLTRASTLLRDSAEVDFSNYERGQLANLDTDVRDVRAETRRLRDEVCQRVRDS